MKTKSGFTRRQFMAISGTAVGAVAWGQMDVQEVLASPVTTPHADMDALRQEIVNSPVRVGLHRAQVFTRVFRETEGKPWGLRKAMALREYFRTVPLYLRKHDRLAGSISEMPGAMPVIVELGIGENGIYTGERPDRKGYLQGKVPQEIREYWMNRNAWGQFRTKILRMKCFEHPDDVPQTLGYKFLSNQGHLSPSLGEVLRTGLDGVLARVRRRQQAETDSTKLAFLKAAETSLLGLTEWIGRYAEFLAAEAAGCSQSDRAAELREMSQVAEKVASEAPETFREALQLIWFVYQAIHVEGHGYSCTPDRIDQLLLPFYESDRQAGRIDDDDVLRLVENFVLKQYDNSFWGPEHHLTQGLCVSGSTPEGEDLTNRLSWLFVEGHTNLSLPEPLLWVRWHPNIDQEFFDFCLERLEQSSCFPMYWNDNAIPDALMELGIDRQDAFNFVPVGCNELAVPGQWYYNPGAHVGYLQAIEATLTSGKGYRGQWRWQDVAPPTTELKDFDQLSDAVGAYLRAALSKAYDRGMKELQAQIRWGKTPLTSCFFAGCIEQAHDMSEGTKYNYLSCGGIAFANAVDCLAAIREVVYENKDATLDEIAAACTSNFDDQQRLRAKLLAAPKHGNDDPRVDDIIRLVERMRDEPMKEICRDPRDGSQFGNSHVVRSGAVKGGLGTPATPDGRLAGTPLASSVAASVGCEKTGPTAVLNSICKLDSTSSWQCGYQANIRFHTGMVTDLAQREKLRAMLNVYFVNGGQELQINVVNSETLRAAQQDPEQYQDLVVRVAGFSEFFVRLTPELQQDVIARMEHK